MAKTLTVYLAADLKKFNSGLDSARGSMNRFDDGMTGLGSKLSNMLGPAAIGAGVAVAGLATAMAVDGVKAAADDEVALAKLSTQMENMGFGALTESVLASMDAMQRQYGISEDVLRPAFARLLSATKDVGAAQSLLSVAMDVSVAKGKSLESVTNALGKAAEGSNGAIAKLGVGIDKTALKSMDLNDITSALSSQFGGSAANQAATYQGQIDRLSIAFDELKESFGKGFLQAMGDTNDQTSSFMTTMKNLEPALQDAGKAIGDTAIDVANIVVATSDAKTGFDSWLSSITGSSPILQEFSNNLIGMVINPVWTLVGIFGKAAAAINNGTVATNTNTAAATNNATATNKASAFMSDLAFKNRLAAQGYGNLTTQTDNNTDTILNNAAGVDRVTAAEQKWIDKAKEKIDALNTQSSALADYSQNVQDWEDKITAFVSGIQATIIEQFDLTKAFEALVGGGETAIQDFKTGVDGEAKKTEWFGNVLAEIQRQGGVELRDYLVQVGGEHAAAWGQALIDNGLVKYMADQIGSVQAQAKLTASSMVPEFMVQGYIAGTEAMAEAMKGVDDAKDDLKKIGKKAGDIIGKNMAAQIASEIAAAVAQAEAAGTAARQEAVAKEQNRQAALTQQALATVVAQALNNANARAGAQTAPVLS